MSRLPIRVRLTLPFAIAMAAVLGAMGSTGDHPGVVRLVDWAPPIQTRLAADGDPDEPA